MTTTESNNNPVKKNAFKKYKWWIALAVVILLVVGVRQSLKSQWVLNIVKNQIETIATEQTNTPLSIGSLQGDLLKNLTISQISFGEEPTLFSADKLSVEYKIWGLFSGRLEIESIQLENFKIFAEQRADSTWNFHELVSEEDDTEPGELPFSIHINELLISGGNVRVESDYLLPESYLQISDFGLSASANIENEDYTILFESLEFRLEEGRLPEELAFIMQADFQDEIFTLNTFAVSMGSSLIDASAKINLDTSDIEAIINVDPLVARDIQPFLLEKPEFDRVTMQARFNGTFDALEINFELDSPDFLRTDILLGLQIEPELAITNAQVHVENIDINRFLDESMDIESGRLFANFDGYLPFDDFESLYGSLNLTLTNSKYEHIILEEFNGTFSIDDGTVDGFLTAKLSGQSVTSNVTLTNIFADEPVWSLESEFININPGYFVNDDELTGVINGQAKANGIGIELSNQNWEYSIQNLSIVLEPYLLEIPELSGIINASEINLNGLITSYDSSFNIEASISEWDSEYPTWYAKTTLQNFNPETVLAMEDLPADISLEFLANGRGINPNDMELDAEVHMLPSTLLGQPLDSLSSKITIRDNIATISETRLVSRFADASLMARLNLSDFTDVSNRLDFELEIGNLSAFKDLVGADTLMVSGNLKGNITPRNSIPYLEVEADFSNILYNQYEINQSNLTSTVALQDEPFVTVTWAFEELVFEEIELNRVYLRSDLVITEEQISGNFGIDLIREDDFGIYHRADFSVNEDLIKITSNRLDILEDVLELSLVQPFTVSIIEENIEMEMLMLSSDIGAYLNTSFQKTGDDIHFYLDAGDVDTGYFQQFFLEEVIVEGIFTGIIDLRTDLNEFILLDFDSKLTSFAFEDLEMAEISLLVNIENERLIVEGYGENQAQRFFEGNLNVPFLLQAPDDLPVEFFDELVQGSFKLNPIVLQDYPRAMEAAGLSSLEGEVEFSFNLEGTAGVPDLVSRLELKNANASGVLIENFWLDLAYNPDEAKVMVESEMISLGQKVLQLEGYHPLEIDFRRFSVTPFEGNEELSINLNTIDLRLNAFSDFLDRDVVRNLEGVLNAQIAIGGTLNVPQINGNIRMENGRIYLVENNITFRNIRSDIGVGTNRVDIRRISMESAGSFTMDGFINLSGLEPSDLEINVSARNFRVFNTRDIDAFITTNTTLAGTMAEPKLVGELLIERGFLFLDNFGEAALEEVRLDEDETTNTMVADFLDVLAVEMNLRIDRRFFIRNQTRPELELEIQGNLDLIKEPMNKFLLFGDAQVVRGYANQLGRRFELERGALLFTGNPSNPDVDIRLAYELRREDDITIWYVVGGTLEDPEFTYESDPEMDLQDIISYTIFGRPFHGLQDWQQGMSGGGGNVVADAAIDLLIDRLESIVADRFGVDVIEISQSPGSGATTVKAGKYISDRLFVALVQELSTDSDSQVIIEYLLRRNLELILTSSTDYRTGVDIIWKLDY